VDEQLGPARFPPEPCAVLSQQQLATLDIDSQVEPTTTGEIAERVGLFCSWRAPERFGGISVGFLSVDTGGLAGQLAEAALTTIKEGD
jgi:hypothetical protein